MPPYRPSSGDKAHLGDGPVGSYWRYRDVETREVVAVKRIDPGTPMDVDAVEKYLKDLKAKPHDHVIGPIYAWCEDLEGDLYNFIAFPFQSAGSLYDLLTTMGTLDMDLVRSYMKQAMEGVNHIHTKLGRRHGDIKLQNILFTNKERTQVALSDFGLVLPGDVDSDLKKSVITGGTVEYLAPEVLDKQIMGNAQDIWAIGVVTYVCLRGRFPFEFMKAKEMRNRISKQLESHTLKDLEQSDNPFALAADIFTKDAMEKIKKGLPDDMEFEMAKDLVGKLMNVDYKKRTTAEDALAHQFLDVKNTDIRPNVPEAQTPSASSATSANHKKSRRSREKNDHAGPSTEHSKSGSAIRKERKTICFVPAVKFMKSEFSPRRFETIGSQLRRGNGSIESDINLKEWKRYNKEVFENLPAKIKWLLFLSLKAGFVLSEGKFELVLHLSQLPRRQLNHLERLAAVDTSSIGGSSSHNRDTAKVERRNSRRSCHGAGQRAPFLPPVVEEGGEAKGAPAPTEQGPLHGAASQHQGTGDSPPPNHPTAVEKLPEQIPPPTSEHGKSPSAPQRGGSGAGKANGPRSSKQPSPAPSVKGQKADDHTSSPDPKSTPPPKEADPPQSGEAEPKRPSRASTIIEEAPKSGPTPPPAERTDIPPAASGDAPPEKPARARSPTPSQIKLPSSKASSVISKASNRPKEGDKQESNPHEAIRAGSPTPSQIPLPPSKANSVIAAENDPRKKNHRQATFETTTDFSGDGEHRDCWIKPSKRRSGTGSVHSRKSRNSIVSSPASIRSLASEETKIATPKKGSKAPSIASAKNTSPVDEGEQKKEKSMSSTTKAAQPKKREGRHVEPAGKKHGGTVEFAEQEKGEEKDENDLAAVGNAEPTSAEQQADTGPSGDSKLDDRPEKGKQKEQPEALEPESKTEATDVYNFNVKPNVQTRKDPNVKAEKYQAKLNQKIQEAIENSRKPLSEQSPARSWTPTTASDASSEQSNGSRGSKGKK